MTLWSGRLIIVASLVLFAAGAGAQDDPDLGRIPSAASGAEIPSLSTQRDLSGQSFIEDTATDAWNRSKLVVPYPPPASPSQENVTTLDTAYRWAATDEVTASFSDRFNVSEASDIAFPSHAMIRNDLKEAFVSWEAASQTYLELGRINHRQGVSLGFSPTDYFKADTQVDLSSVDPSVLRNDRLGVAMIEGQRIWQGGAVTALYAPRLQRESAIPIGTEDGFDPRFSQTNGQQRALLAVSQQIDALTALASLYQEGARTQLGAEATYPIGQSVVAYGEWSGGRRPNLITQALEFGKETGTIPASAPSPFPNSSTISFQNTASVGVSWSGAGSLTVNLEYHYNEAGLSRQDWKNWFATGSNPLFPDLPREVLYVRDYANVQQEPLSRNQGFFRLDWRPQFNSKFDLSDICFVAIGDASFLNQASITYFLSNTVSIGSYVTVNAGAPRTEWGSAEQATNFILKIDFYL